MVNPNTPLRDVIDPIKKQAYETLKTILVDMGMDTEWLQPKHVGILTTDRKYAKHVTESPDRLTKTLSLSAQDVQAIDIDKLKTVFGNDYFCNVEDRLVTNAEIGSLHFRFNYAKDVTKEAVGEHTQTLLDTTKLKQEPLDLVVPEIVPAEELVKWWNEINRAGSGLNRDNLDGLQQLKKHMPDIDATMKSFIGKNCDDIHQTLNTLQGQLPEKNTKTSSKIFTDAKFALAKAIKQTEQINAPQR